MNTFTFTDDEVIYILSSISVTIATLEATGDYRDKAIYENLLNKLERKQRTLISESTIKANSIEDGLVSQLLRKRELILKQAIDNHLGDWVLADLEGRLRSEEFSGKLTIYFLDDKPILEMAKVESYISSNGHSVGFNAEETYKFL
tara:strand:+ start:89 stop:526 length:438 start_codon:yes stop_codon:yes gene_type:complete